MAYREKIEREIIGSTLSPEATKFAQSQQRKARKELYGKATNLNARLKTGKWKSQIISRGIGGPLGFGESLDVFIAKEMKKIQISIEREIEESATKSFEEARKEYLQVAKSFLPEITSEDVMNLRYNPREEMAKALVSKAYGMARILNNFGKVMGGRSDFALLSGSFYKVAQDMNRFYIVTAAPTSMKFAWFSNRFIGSHLGKLMQIPYGELPTLPTRWLNQILGKVYVKRIFMSRKHYIRGPEMLRNFYTGGFR